MTPQFEPRDENFEIKVRQSFAKQTIMNTLNATVESVKPGQVELSFPYQPNLTQQHGFIHAGVISTILDSACGYAAFSLMPESAEVLTIEFKINLLSPAKADRFKAVGTVIKPGKTITLANGEIFGYTQDNEKLIATMTGTLMSLFDRKGVNH